MPGLGPAVPAHVLLYWMAIDVAHIRCLLPGGVRRTFPRTQYGCVTTRSSTNGSTAIIGVSVIASCTHHLQQAQDLMPAMLACLRETSKAQA